MKIEVELSEMWYFRAHNKDYAMGHHFQEDDWYIDVYSSTIEDLIDEVAKEIIFSGIHIDYWSLKKAKRLEYNGDSFTTSEEEVYGSGAFGSNIEPEHSNFLEKVKDSKKYKDLLENKKQKLKEEELVRQQKFEEENRTKEIEKLKELQEKYKDIL